MTETFLGNHFKVFKQFLDISDDPSNTNKPPSVRAARAREKLLNLSEAQFRELSTDVYDELRRRIDESRRQPEFLLPKSTFHPKRNQARERLSTLPQNRFKGLVSDVSFEIERRNLHIIPEQEKENFVAGQSNDNLIQPKDDEPARELVQEPPVADTLPLSKDSDLQNQTIGLSSKTVVPTKANLTWSSDEEQDPEPETLPEPELVPEFKPEVVVESPSRSPVKSNNDHLIAIDQFQRELSLQKQSYDELSVAKHQIETQLSEALRKNDELMQQVESFGVERAQFATTKQEYDDKILQLPDKVSYDNLLKEIDSLKATTAQLRLENQSLKNTSHSRANSSLSKDLSNFDIDKSALENRNSKILDNKYDYSKNPQITVLLDKLASLDAPPPKPQTSNNMKDEIVKWQKKFEELQSTKSIQYFNKSNLLKDSQIQSLVSPNGLISLQTLVKLQSNIESFIISIDDVNSNSELIFEKVSQISLLANQLANQADNNQLNRNELAVTVRNCASHLLTVTRYYNLFINVLPKFIIDRSVNELMFSVCELIGVSKIAVESNSTTTTSQFQPTTKTTEEQSIGVRPLRMANKLKSANTSLDSIPIKEVSPQPSKITNLATKFERLHDTISASSPRTTPTKKANILDRMKHFESPPPEEFKKEFSPKGNLTKDTSSFILNRSSLEIKKTPTHSKNNSLVDKHEVVDKSGVVAFEPKADKSHDIAASVATAIQGNGIHTGSKQVPVDTQDESQDDKQTDLSNDDLRSSTAETTPSKETQEESIEETPSKPFVPLRTRINERVPSAAGSEATIKTDKTSTVIGNDDDSTNTSVGKKSVKIAEPKKEKEQEEEEDEKTAQARQRQEYRKSMAAATFNVDLFDIDDPDNTLTQVLLYLEHQTVEVISTIQMLLSTIKKPNATRGELVEKSMAITEVISQMTEATNTSMNQTRNAQLKEHGNWVVKSLEDCHHRMNILCKPSSDKKEGEFADRSFKQRLAGISFDIAKCTKELVKTVEEASLKEDIANIDARLSHNDDLR